MENLSASSSEARRGQDCEWGGGTLSLLALVIVPLTTHPFRDGAPFLLLVETPPTYGRSLRFPPMLRELFLLTFSPSPLVATIYLIE